MRTLLVLAHQRKDSITAEVARVFSETLEQNDHLVETADLCSEGFNPVMSAEDEPQWHVKGRLERSSLAADVRQEIKRIERNSSAVLIFPVYWWSMPAILKGWIDRVWTYGFAYGAGNQIPLRKVWMIAVAGCDVTVYRDNGYEKAMEIQLTEGVLDYCGVPERRLVMLYDSMNPDQSSRLLSKAESLSRQFVS